MSHGFDCCDTPDAKGDDFRADGAARRGTLYINAVSEVFCPSEKNSHLCRKSQRFSCMFIFTQRLLVVE